MNEQQVQEWLARHGGVDVDTRSVSGQTVYIAKDGSRLVLTRMTDGNYRVDDNFEQGTPSAPSYTPAPGSQQAAPSTPTAPQGGAMTQAELEALLGQRGPYGPNDFREEVRNEEIANPKYDGSDPLVPPTIKASVTYRTWIKPGTNQRLTVKVNADGTYTKTFDGPDSGINVDKPAQAGANEWHTEGTPDSSQPSGFDNSRPIMVRTGPNGQRETRPLTEAELKSWRANNLPAREEKPVASHPGWTQITVVDPTTQTSKTTFRGPDGKESDTLPPQPTTAKPEKDGNGNWGYWEQKPGEAPRWVPIQGASPAGESPKPVEVNGTWGVWKPGQNGAAPTFEPVKVPPKPEDASLPSDFPVYTFNPNVPGYGLFEYTTAVTQYQRAHPDKIKPQQAFDAIKRAQEQASVGGTQVRNDQAEARGLRQEQANQRAQNIGVANQRQANVGNMMTQAGNYAAPYAGKVAPGATSAYGDSLRAQYDITRAMGGYDVPPEVEIPTFARAAMAPAAVPPNALGLGGTGSIVTPGAAPAAAPMTADRAAGIYANPVFRPAAPAAYPGAAPAAASAPAGGPVVSAPAIAAPRGPDPNVGRPGDPYTMPPVVNPVTGEPTGLPQSRPAAGSPASGNVQMAPPQPPAFLRAATTPTDPEQYLLASGYPPDVAREAARRIKMRRGEAPMMGVA